MFGMKKLKEWADGRFAHKGDVTFQSDRYWELWHELHALKEYLHVEYQKPSLQQGRMISKKDAK